MSPSARHRKQCVLGLDPGIARTGYAVLEVNGNDFRAIEYGLIETKPSEPYPRRLLTIEKQLEKILTRHSPTTIGMEKIYFSKNVKTAFAVGQARGVLLLTAARHHLLPVELSPQEVKLTVSGYGNAEKSQVQRMMRSLLRLPSLPKPDDVADALAIAYTAATHLRSSWRVR